MNAKIDQINAKDAAELIGCSLQTVYKLCRDGKHEENLRLKEENAELKEKYEELKNRVKFLFIEFDQYFEEG